jgi:hypothetical protein
VDMPQISKLILWNLVRWNKLIGASSLLIFSCVKLTDLDQASYPDSPISRTSLRWTFNQVQTTLTFPKDLVPPEIFCMSQELHTGDNILRECKTLILILSESYRT